MVAPGLVSALIYERPLQTRSRKETAAGTMDGMVANVFKLGLPGCPPCFHQNGELFAGICTHRTTDLRFLRSGIGLLRCPARFLCFGDQFASCRTHGSTFRAIYRSGIVRLRRTTATRSPSASSIQCFDSLIQLIAICDKVGHDLVSVHEFTFLGYNLG